MEFLNCWERVKEKTDLNKLNQLAKTLNVSQQFVSKKKRENVFPVEWAYKIAQKYDLSTDWILNGGKTENKAKDDFFLQLEKWGKETSGSEDIQWIKNQIDQTFPMFKEWRIRKEEEESNTSMFPDEKIA